MSVGEVEASPVTPGCDVRRLSGWGRTSWSRSTVISPRSEEQVREVLELSARSRGSVIARGAGRSYGDAAQNDGGTVLDMRALDRIVAIDPARMLLTAQAGATVAQLMACLSGYGLGLPVLPGTRHVTLAGAIASDIHGKNHHRDGALARHVAAIKLCTPRGDLLELAPDRDPHLFYATLGGMGLTGVVLEATLQVEPLSSPWVAADLDRTDGLEETFAVLGSHEGHRYSVAWLDLLAEGSSMGRAIISRAEPLPAGIDAPYGRGGRSARGQYPGTLMRAPLLEVPHRFPSQLLKPAAVRALNALRWRAAPRRVRARPLALAPYFFPLDGLGAWNRLYGDRGLVQYQFVIPAGGESALERCFQLIAERSMPVYLAVFKRFGAAFGGPLSFPMEGWTLALDLPGEAPGLREGLEALDEVVAGSGGRVYLTKDSRLRPEMLAAMYPQLDRFKELRDRVDPEQVLRSDLGARLELFGQGA